MSDSPVYTAQQCSKPDLGRLALGDLDWVHPSESNGSGGMCVEMTFVPGGGVAVRDSLDPGTVLAFSAAEVDVFLRAAGSGEFDRFRVLADRA
jgi:hypothetical protein